MIQFLETYVGTGFAIWAEQMQLNKEEKAFIKNHEQAKKQLQRQGILLQSNLYTQESEQNSDALMTNFSSTQNKQACCN